MRRNYNNRYQLVPTDGRGYFRFSSVATSNTS